MNKVFLFLLVLLAGCGGGFDARNDRFMKSFGAGNYAAAANGMQSWADENPGAEYYLAGLQCGAGFMWADDSGAAEQCFDMADNASQASGDTTYEKLEFEKIMTATYSGAAMLTARDSNARAMFNRAYAMQVQSVQDAQKQIDKLTKEFRKTAREIPGMPSIESIVSDADFEMEKTAEVAAMSDFVNPYATWLAAVYAGLNGDLSNSENYLRRVQIFAPDNKFVASDFAAIKSGKKHIWVVFEGGLIGQKKIKKLAPKALQKWNINLSVPEMSAGRAAQPGRLIVRAGGKTIQTEFLADMTRIAKTDLSKYRRRDIIASVLFEVGKVAAAGTAVVAGELTARNQSKNGNDGRAALFSGAGQIAAALLMANEKDWDLRSWDALPDNVQVARVPMPASRTIDIDGVGQVVVPGDINNAAVFIRVPLTGAKPGIIIGKIN